MIRGHYNAPANSIQIRTINNLQTYHHNCVNAYLVYCRSFPEQYVYTMDDDEFFDDALFEFDSPTRTSPTLRKTPTRTSPKTRRTPTTPRSMLSTPTSSPLILNDEGIVYHPDMFASTTQSRVTTPTTTQSRGTYKKRKLTPIELSPTTGTVFAHRNKDFMKQRTATVRKTKDDKHHNTYEKSRDQVLAFVEKHNRIPTIAESSDDGFVYRQWLNYQRLKYQRQHYLKAYKDFENNPILKQFMTNPNYQNSQYDQDDLIQNDSDYRKYLFAFADKYKRVPNADDVRASSDAKRVLAWLHYQKKKIRKGNQALYELLAVNPIVKENLDKPVQFKAPR